MKRSVMLAFVVIIECFLITSCGITVQESIVGSDGSVIESSSSPSVAIEATSKVAETTEVEDHEEALFVDDVTHAINNGDYEFLQEHADYYNPTYGLEGIEIGVKLLKEMLLEGESILGYEAIEDSNIALPAKMIRLYTESGHSRCIIIYNDSQQGFRFSDPLITMGNSIVRATQSYLDAIKACDIQFLYDYLVMIHEDSEAKPYNDEDHNQEYVAVAKALVGKYQDQMQLNTLELELLRVNNDTTQFVSTVYMEYSVAGKSTDGKAVQHNIQGVYEAPLTGVLDEWLIE